MSLDCDLITAERIHDLYSPIPFNCFVSSHNEQILSILRYILFLGAKFFFICAKILFLYAPDICICAIILESILGIIKCVHSVRN